MIRGRARSASRSPAPRRPAVVPLGEAALSARVRLGVLAVLAVLAVLTAFAVVMPGRACAAVVALDDPERDPDLAGQLSLLVDDTGRLTFEDIERLDAEGRLRPLPRHVSAGFSPGAAWVAFTVTRGLESSADWWLEVEPPLTDHIDVRLRRPDGQVEVHRGGEAVPVADRDRPWRAHAFRLTIPPRVEQRIYVRISGVNTLYAQFRLWPPKAFHAARVAADLTEGAFGGILLLILGLGVVTAVRTRLAADAAYAFGLVTLTLWAGANRGFPQWLFAPSNPTLNDDVLALSLGLAPLALTWLATALVEARGSLATTARVLRTIMAVLAFGFALAAVAGVARRHLLPTLNIMVAASFATTFVFCLFAAVRGAAGARFFMATFAPFLIWGCISSTSALGFWVGTVGRYALWQWVTIVHVLLLQLAVAARTRAIVVERERLAGEMERAKEEMARQTQFVRVLSHELRTPLSLIDHAAQLMKVAGPESERQLDRILAGGRQIASLLEAALTEGRLASEWALAPTSVDPCALVEAAVEQARLRTENHVLRVRCEAVPATADWDPRLIGLLLGTLLDNARKYSPEGGSVQVDVTGDPGEDPPADGRPPPRFVRIDVRDEGIGIPEEARELVFERFYRAHTVGDISGAGLGLTIARRIATLHGGTITCRSVLGEGSTFTVRLPV